MQNTLIIFAATVMAVFLITSYVKYELTRSISAIYYKLPKNKKWIFTAVLITFAVPLIVAMNYKVAGSPDMVNDISLSLVMAGATFIIFTGLAANARDNEITERNHVIGATGGMILTGIGLFFQPGGWLVVAVAGASLILYFTKPANHTYWIELLNIIIALYILFN